MKCPKEFRNCGKSESALKIREGNLTIGGKVKKFLQNILLYWDPIGRIAGQLTIHKLTLSTEQQGLQ